MQIMRECLCQILVFRKKPSILRSTPGLGVLKSNFKVVFVASAKGAASFQIGPSSRGNETRGTARGLVNDALPNLTAEQQARIEEVRGQLHNPGYNRSVSFPSLTSELASVPALWRKKGLLEAVLKWRTRHT